MKRDHDETHAQLLHFAEEVGLFFESGGLPPMAGRILGWLLVSDPVEQSAGELGEVLDASKASISTNLRILMHIGLIRRTAVRGKRGAYYEILPEQWSRMIEEKISALTTFRKLTESGLSILAQAPAERRERLAEIHDFYTFFEDEFPKSVARYRASKERK